VNSSDVVTEEFLISIGFKIRSANQNMLILRDGDESYLMYWRNALPTLGSLISAIRDLGKDSVRVPIKKALGL